MCVWVVFVFEGTLLVHKEIKLKQRFGTPVLMHTHKWYMALCHNGGTLEANLKRVPTKTDILVGSREAKTDVQKWYPKTSIWELLVGCSREAKTDTSRNGTLRHPPPFATQPFGL